MYKTEIEGHLLCAYHTIHIETNDFRTFRWHMESYAIKMHGEVISIQGLNMLLDKIFLVNTTDKEKLLEWLISGLDVLFPSTKEE